MSYRKWLEVARSYLTNQASYYDTFMSDFKPNSAIFEKTVRDDMAEMGFVTLSRGGMSECYAEEMDFNVYVLLSHGHMALMDLVGAICKILNCQKGTITLRVMDSMQRLNNDKQRICRDATFYCLTN